MLCPSKQYPIYDICEDVSDMWVGVVLVGLVSGSRRERRGETRQRQGAPKRATNTQPTQPTHNQHNQPTTNTQPAHNGTREHHNQHKHTYTRYPIKIATKPRKATQSHAKPRKATQPRRHVCTCPRVSLSNRPHDCDRMCICIYPHIISAYPHIISAYPHGSAHSHIHIYVCCISLSSTHGHTCKSSCVSTCPYSALFHINLAPRCTLLKPSQFGMNFGEFGRILVNLSEFALIFHGLRWYCGVFLVASFLWRVSCGVVVVLLEP